MRKSICILLAAHFVMALEPNAFAMPHRRVERVEFEGGRAVLKGRVKGYETVNYLFRAGAGESLEVSLKTGRPSIYFNLLAPGEQETAFFTGSVSSATFQGVAPTSGEYTARVYLMRNDARRQSVAHYVLTIALGEKSQTKENGPDYADGLTGGPDFWEVYGVAAGDALNIRKAPKSDGALVAHVANGAVLRNLGCKNTRGQRWCRISRADAPAVGGWVNGRYLRESGGPR